MALKDHRSRTKHRLAARKREREIGREEGKLESERENRASQLKVLQCVAPMEIMDHFNVPSVSAPLPPSSSVVLYFVCSLTLISVLTARFGEIQRNPVWVPLSSACKHLCSILNTAITLQPGLHIIWWSFRRSFHPKH